MTPLNAATARLGCHLDQAYENAKQLMVELGPLRFEEMQEAMCSRENLMAMPPGGVECVLAFARIGFTETLLRLPMRSEEDDAEAGDR